MNKFNELLSNYIDEGVSGSNLNPGFQQLKMYFTRKCKSEPTAVVDMLVDIFTETETNVLATLEEYYQAIRSDLGYAPPRNAPMGRAAIARKKTTTPSPQATE